MSHGVAGIVRAALTEAVSARDQQDDASYVAGVVLREHLRETADATSAVAALVWSGHGFLASRCVEQLLPAIRDAEQRAELRWLHAMAQLGAGETCDALRTLRRARAEATEGPWADRLAGLELFAHLVDADLEAVLALGAELEARVALDGAARMHLLAVRAIFGFLSRDLDQANDLLDEMESLPELDQDPGARLVAQLLRVPCLDVRDPRIPRLVEAAAPLAHQLGGIWLGWWQITAALSRYNIGDWDAALQVTEQALDAGSPMSRPLHGVAAIIAIHRGEPGQARLHASRILALPAAEGLGLFYEGTSAMAEAVVAELDGRPVEAGQIVRRMLDGEIGPHHGSTVYGLGARLVRIALSAGDRGLAERLVDALDAGGPGTRPNALLGRALLDEDLEALSEARDLLLAEGLLLEAGWADEERARLLARSGLGSAAREALHGAGERFRSLSAAGELSRAEAALRSEGVRVGARGPRSRGHAGWESLTPAQLRVAELVARGSTNPEIARTFHVSPRTVQSQVSQILTKLDLSSRSELAAAVARRG